MSIEEKPLRSWQQWPKILPLLVTTIVCFVLIYAVIVGFHWVSDVVRPVFIPMLISVALAYLLEPVVRWLEVKRCYSRGSATLITLVLATLIIILLLVFLIPSFWEQISDIIAKLPVAMQSVINWLNPKLLGLKTRNPKLYDKITQPINEFLQDPNAVTEPIAAVIKNSLSQIGTLTASFLNLILVPLFVYYILADFPQLQRIGNNVIPPRHRRVALHLFLQVDMVLRNFVRGQLLVCLAMAALYATGFACLRVPMWFTLGILSGFGHLVPYFGTATAAFLVIGITGLNNPEWWRLLGVILMYPIVQSTEGFILTPKILGDKLELHPFVILVGIIIGHHIFGIIGIVLAAPVMASAKVFILFFYELYINTNFYRKSGLEKDEPTFADVLAGPWALAATVSSTATVPTAATAVTAPLIMPAALATAPLPPLPPELATPEVVSNSVTPNMPPQPIDDKANNPPT
jgi:predicted PurR-regulated permease PerM